MPVKVKYTSSIVKQAYRFERDGTQVSVFEPAAIGVEFNKELYAETKEIAYNLITKWSNDPFYDYCIISVDKIIHDEVPRNAFFYETEQRGTRADMGGS